MRWHQNIFLASPHTVASLISGLSQPMVFIDHQLNSSQLVHHLRSTFFFKTWQASLVEPLDLHLPDCHSVTFVFQATEDARKVAEEERALALAEIEKARAAIEKVEKALHVLDSASSSREKEVLLYFKLNLDVRLICVSCQLPLAHIYFVS